MIQMILESVLVANPIETKIRCSASMDDGVKRQFLNLLSYLTPSEISELETLL
jgi:hypothetical protein